MGQFVKFIASKPSCTTSGTDHTVRVTLRITACQTNDSTALEAELNLNRPTCYTDSMVALYWIVGVDRSGSSSFHRTSRGQLGVVLFSNFQSSSLLPAGAVTP